ncbi:molybdopterin-dependent oxidoreductase [Alkalilimnicola ehrlichii]|uniref:molybdopterin-dependent oxidoreductase n=1 Tax=Alkalilimnicola ehrlichii TaxID=351052 RepID=UPI003BA29DEF
MNVLQNKLNRRRFLQASGAAGAAGVAGLNAIPGISTLEASPGTRARATSDTVVTKSVCQQCSTRCGLDVYTTNGRVHAIYGNPDAPLSNGKLCPKGHLGPYILYDADRFKGPMKRTNPKKGRNEDPGFVPISWDEALDTVAARLTALRERNESHRFVVAYGRGWGPADAGLFGTWGRLYGSSSIGIGHSSICADGSKKVKRAMDGNDSYNSYDYENCNCLLIFGAGFLESFRPYNANMQMWGRMRSKGTRITMVDVRNSVTAAAADRKLIVSPGTDGAIALAIAHVILTEGLWDRPFVGDFTRSRLRFETGKPIDPDTFSENWVKDLPAWWNTTLKDATPAWAEGITGVPAEKIVATAKEFGSTRPAIAVFERGPTAHTNGAYNGMAIHALNALVGSMFAEGGLSYQMGSSAGSLPINPDDYMDDYAREMEGKYPRIDMARTDAWPMTSNMIQDIAKNHLTGSPYKMDTIMFYTVGPIYSGPDCTVWEEALQDVFVIDTSPSPQESAQFADLILPDHTYLERLEVANTYPFQGYPMSMIREPAVKPLYDTMQFGNIMIELGKRMPGPMADYYQQVGSVENVVAAFAAGFENDPGDNGVNDLASFKEKGVWYKTPYLWRQIDGEFYEWDGHRYSIRMSEDDVKAKLLKTPSGKFEFQPAWFTNEKHAAHIQKHLGIPRDMIGFPHYVEPQYQGGGDLHLISPKLPLSAEGRSANLPHTHAVWQPTQGGTDTVYMEIHPQAAAARGIKDRDRVRISSSVGAIECFASVSGGVPKDTVVLPLAHGHWGSGRWAQNKGVSGSVNEVIPNVVEPVSGLVAFSAAKVFVEKV